MKKETSKGEGSDTHARSHKRKRRDTTTGCVGVVCGALGWGWGPVGAGS